MGAEFLGVESGVVQSAEVDIGEWVSVGVESGEWVGGDYGKESEGVESAGVGNVSRGVWE